MFVGQDKPALCAVFDCGMCMLKTAYPNFDVTFNLILKLITTN